MPAGKVDELDQSRIALVRLGINKGLGHHPWVIEQQNQLLVSINDRLGALCCHFGTSAGQAIDSIKLEGLLSDAFQIAILDADDLDPKEDTYHSMDS